MTAYWIARSTVKDQKAYTEYAKTVGPIVKSFGGRFLARGGTYMHLEGQEHARNVIVEFSTYDEAVACYKSREYQKAYSYIVDAAERDLCIVNGI